MATIVEVKDGYRVRSLYDGSYTIEKFRDGEWRMCFGVDSREQGLEYLKNPDSIERQIKYYKRAGWFILAIFISSILGILIIEG